MRPLAPVLDPRFLCRNEGEEQQGQRAHVPMSGLAASLTLLSPCTRNLDVGTLTRSGHLQLSGAGGEMTAAYLPPSGYATVNRMRGSLAAAVILTVFSFLFPTGYFTTFHL